MENFSLIKPHIEKIAIEHGFKDYKLTFNNGSDLGFIGLLKRCVIIENDRKLTLMCKFLPQDEDHNSKFNTFMLFEREVMIYNDLFPLFEKFQLENGVERNDKDGFWSYPICYYANYDRESPDKSLIIMEDLTTDNFEVKDKFVPSDFQHTAKLFIELGKLHGLSLAIKLKEPKKFENFMQLKNSMCSVMSTDSMKHLAPRNCKLASKLFQLESEREIIEKILSFEHSMWNKVGKILDENDSEPYSVICHGDVWINNVLYNYHNTNNDSIKGIKLVDWQMTFYGSAGSELTYYLYCCVDKSVREHHQEELFQLYYDSMGKILSRFSIEIDEVFPYLDFKKQLQTFGLYAFAMAVFAIPLLCKYPEQLFEDENAILTEDEQGCVEHYQRRMRDIILDMIDMKIL